MHRRYTGNSNADVALSYYLYIETDISAWVAPVLFQEGASLWTTRNLGVQLASQMAE